MEQDIDGEMDQLLEDIPIGLILDDDETETDLLGAATEPPTIERGGAMQAVASQRCTNASGEGGQERGHYIGHPCQGLPILITKNARTGPAWEDKLWSDKCKHCRWFHCGLNTTGNVRIWVVTFRSTVMVRMHGPPH